MKTHKIPEKIIDWALREDIGSQDLTTNLLVPQNHRSKASIIAKEDTVLAGLEVARRVFQKLDKRMSFSSKFRDGQFVRKNTKIIFLKGQTRAILTGERVALNFLSHLCGIATKTRALVGRAAHSQIKILDTRKTTPGLRILEKAAVRAGGGTNHRSSLGEMVLIKDNHRALLDQTPWPKRIASLRSRTRKKIEVEVDNLEQFKEVLEAGPDFILLDNMSPATIKQAVKIKENFAGRKPKLEASGGINSKNIAAYAKTGVDFISIGELTHSVSAIDLSLEIES